MYKPSSNSRQASLFWDLETMLDSKHPLFKLANMVDWSLFEKSFAPLFCADNGRPPKPIRLMTGSTIYWAKTGMREFTMRDAVNDYLEASGANRPSIGGEESILAHRKIAANRLAIDCIYVLSKEELSKVDRELEGIVGDLPRQVCGIRK